MIDMDLKTGHYNQLTEQDDFWFTSSIKRIGSEDLYNNSNSIGYYIEGNEHIAACLKLKLHVNNLSTVEETEKKFCAYCIHLIKKSLSNEMAEQIETKIHSLESFKETKGQDNVALHEPSILRMNGITEGYSRVLEISRKRDQKITNGNMLKGF
ncbi:MAG: hypothetical protein ACKO37_09340 [Vampirovibrionales bacterium]